MTTTAIVADASPRWASIREAEHGYAQLAGSLGSVVSASTHFATSTSTVLVTVEVDGGAVRVLGSCADSADRDRVRARHGERQAGRLFIFPGHDLLVGVMTVGELIADSAIDEVVMIGHREPVDPDQGIDTQSYVRPELADGRVRLVVRPAVGGLVIPFEQPDPTACCADH